MFLVSDTKSFDKVNDAIEFIKQGDFGLITYNDILGTFMMQRVSKYRYKTNNSYRVLKHLLIYRAWL
jgi:hypothetical protein